VVKVQEKLAEDHPSRLASQHDLATVYQANGQINEAVELLQRVVNLRRDRYAVTQASLVVSEELLEDMLQSKQLDGEPDTTSLGSPDTPLDAVS
jgi:thioredoxin-like negative regulator of GroEL